MGQVGMLFRGWVDVNNKTLLSYLPLGARINLSKQPSPLRGRPPDASLH